MCTRMIRHSSISAKLWERVRNLEWEGGRTQFNLKQGFRVNKIHNSWILLVAFSQSTIAAPPPPLPPPKGIEIRTTKILLVSSCKWKFVSLLIILQLKWGLWFFFPFSYFLSGVSGYGGRGIKGLETRFSAGTGVI